MHFIDLLDRLELSNFVTIQIDKPVQNNIKNKIEKITAIEFKNGNAINFFNKDNNDIDLNLKNFLKSHPIVFYDNNFLDFISDEKNIDLDINLGHDYDILSLAKIILFQCEDFSINTICQHYNIHDCKEKIGLIFFELLKDFCSLPLNIINEIVKIVRIKDIPNKKLFFDLENYLLNSQKFNGIYKNRFIDNVNSLILQSHGNNGLSHLKNYKKILSKEGLFSQKWKFFEVRKSQVDFYIDLLENLENNKIFLAEAGTGMGKTLAYLLATIIHSKKNKKTIVISTYTKYLQDQIFYKDLPLIAEILDIKFTSVLIKGRKNYICKTRLNDLVQNFNLLLNEKESESLIQLLIWNYFTKTGEISECNSFNVRYNNKVWNLVKSQANHCNPRKCHKWGKCYHITMSDYIGKANILVVNHSLLLSNLFSKNIIFNEDVSYVLDEVHNIINIAHDTLTEELNITSFDNIFSFFDEENTRIINFLDDIKNSNSIVVNLFSNLQNISLVLKSKYELFFRDYLNYKKIAIEQKSIIENTNLEFKNLNIGKIDEILKSFYQQLSYLIEEMILNKCSESICNDLEIVIEELKYNHDILNRIKGNSKNDICWSHSKLLKGDLSVSLHCAPKQLNKFLSENIFGSKSTGVLCSATLQFNDSFDYFKEQFGFEKDCQNIETAIYESPFIYQEQMKLFVFKNELSVSENLYFEEIASQIISFRKKIKNRILVLCTSYIQIVKFKKIIQSKIYNNNIFYQLPGKNRMHLVENYLNNSDSILFGTSSFWEGIDLPGKNIETLWITKIPFSNPTEPLFIAQSEKYIEINKNAFFDYSLPDATIKFKQGFGRLIRSLSDYGICILSDPRLLNKKYGKVILDTLPLDYILYNDVNDVITKSQLFLNEFN